MLYGILFAVKLIAHLISQSHWNVDFERIVCVNLLLKAIALEVIEPFYTSCFLRLLKERMYLLQAFWSLESMPNFNPIREVNSVSLITALMFDFSLEYFDVNLALGLPEVWLQDFICDLADVLIEKFLLKERIHVAEVLEHVLLVEWFSWSEVVAQSILAAWNQEDLSVPLKNGIFDRDKTLHSRHILL